MNKTWLGPAILKCCLLGCFAIGLLFCLTPLTDFDLDGMDDSLVTDSLILKAALPMVVVPFLFFKRLYEAHPGKPGLYASLLVPPPIPL